MNLKKYNIGIIGLGVGEQHLIGFLKNKKCNVKTICDFDRKKLKKIKKKYKNITTTINIFFQLMIKILIVSVLLHLINIIFLIV